MDAEPWACDYCGTVWAKDYDEYILLLEHYEPPGQHAPEDEGCTETRLCNRRCLLHWLADDIYPESEG